MLKNLNDINALYVGSLDPEGSSKSRYDALEKRLKSIEHFSINPTHKSFKKIKTKLNKYFSFNLDKELNLVINKTYYDLIWFDKPVNISLKFVKSMRKKLKKTILISHITDDIETMKNYSKNLPEILKNFDYVFTCNQDNIKEFKDIPLIYSELGYDHNNYAYTHYKNRKTKQIISFTGHYEDHYAKTIIAISKALSGSKFTLVINGSGWWKKPKIWLQNNIKVRNGWIQISKLQKIYQESISAIGLYSLENRNKTSGRIFELSAMGVPLLTHGNPLIERYIGKNYIDLNKKNSIKNLEEVLTNKEYLVEISEGAHKKILENKCSWDDRIEDCLREIFK